MEDGWGTCNPSPQPRSDGKYADKTVVTLTAVPAPGYVFDHWEGPVSASGNPTTVVMDRDKQVTAYFAPSDDRYVLSVTVSSPQNGTVSLTPSPPDGGYPVNTRVTVTAYAASGYVFSHWQGDLAGTAATGYIIMDGDKSISAIFNPTVAAICDPPSGGTVALNPPQGSTGLPSGTDVTVTATAAEGYRFDHWSGDLSGTSDTATLTVDAPKTITAHFVKKGPFPWWWIAVGIVLLFPAIVVARVIYVVATRRS